MYSEARMEGAQDFIGEHTGPLERRIEELEAEIEEKDKEIVRLKRRIKELNDKIQELKNIKVI